MAGLLNREMARNEEAEKLAQQSAKAEDLEICQVVIAQLQHEKAALRQALYEMALELAEARVEAASQSLRALDFLPSAAQLVEDDDER
jgi:hypothetical protein